MRMITNITTDKKDIVKSGNSVDGFKDELGVTNKMVGVLIYEKEEANQKTGLIEKKIVTSIKKENGEFISSVSPTIQNSVEMIVATYSEEEIKAGISIIVKSKKSANGGREFLYVDLA